MEDRPPLSPRDDDPDDVHWALATASSLHTQGNYLEALKWLRKAAASAESAEREDRARELVRLVSQLEDHLGAVTTQRGLAQSGAHPDLGDELTMRSRAAAVAVAGGYDDLDSPTHVDSSARAPVWSGDLLPDSSPTMVPLTQHSASEAPQRAAANPVSAAAGGAGSRPGALPRPSSPGGRPLVPRPPPIHNRTLQAADLSALGVVAPLDGEATQAMEVPDAVREEMARRRGDARADATLPVMPALDRWRVALLSTADGEARVIWLAPGASAPEGAGVAMLVPVSATDAARIASLLGLSSPEE
ncbi:MAG: hypothetical protein KC731_06945 [Myxococcales bacterium]|nr:hypothetical protein [Myxococcales bacterium]